MGIEGVHKPSILVRLEPHVNAPSLVQIGPWLELELVKGEEGLCAGHVLFHTHVEKDAQLGGPAVITCGLGASSDQS